MAVLGVEACGALPLLRAAEPLTIDPEVLRAVRAGTARVLVEVRVPDGGIAVAQNRVLAGLAGSHFSLIRRYDTIPLLLIEVQDDALAALERMANFVVRIRLDSPRAPAAPTEPR